MGKTSPQAYYQENIQTYQQDLAQLNSTYVRLSYARLALFIGGVLLTYFVFSFHTGWGLFTGFTSMVGFLFLVSYHIQLAGKREDLSTLLSINQAEADFLEGDLSTFDPGEEFVDSTHPYSYDLDIFGKSSIFHFLNRSVSVIGKQKLATSLQSPPVDKNDILQRQQAITELSRAADWSQEFQVAGKGNWESSEDIQAILQWMQGEKALANISSYRLLLWVMPLLFVISFAVYLLRFTSIGGGIFLLVPPSTPLLVFIINLMIIGRHLRLTQKEHIQMGQKSDLLKKYQRLLEQVEKAPFTSDLLKTQQQKLFTANGQASQAIEKLASLSYYFDQRLNMIMGVILNGTLLWDLQCLIRLDRWREANKHELPSWLDSMASWDSLNSYGRMAFNHPDYVLPVLSERNMVLQATDLGHALIPSASRVTNEVAMEEGRLLLITGANMAGKSTFLRTMGTNLILAMNGATVCASHFEFTPQTMISSIRATDSLEDHESYFYAELKQLKKIIDLLQQTSSVFVIVDEMLRGTNSKDKQTGSRKFIEQLISYGASGLVATHDLSLGTLEKAYPKKVTNKRFEVDIQENELSFDYKLRNGISQNLNATFLMQKMGIMP